MGRTNANGYGSVHQANRRRWDELVQRGEIACGKCGRLIVPGSPWDLSHPVDDKTRPPVPWHRSCNRSYASAVTKPRRRQQRGESSPPQKRGRLRDLHEWAAQWDEITHPAPFRSPRGRPASRAWTKSHMTREAYTELHGKDRE